MHSNSLFSVMMVTKVAIVGERQRVATYGPSSVATFP
jgi:hypothetical protein